MSPATLPLDAITEPITAPAPPPAHRPRWRARKPRTTHRAPTSRWSLIYLQVVFIALGIVGIVALFRFSGAHFSLFRFFGSYHW